MADDIEYGNGYDQSLSPIKLGEDGSVEVKGTTGGSSSSSSSSTGGIGIVIPGDVEYIVWNPLVPQVAPPTSMFSFVAYGSYNVLFINESLGNINQILWDFGDDTTSTEFNPLHIYATSGTYNVSLWVSNAGGEDYHWEMVVIADISPVVDFDFAIGGYSVYLTNLSNTAEYLWDFGDGNTSTARNPKHLYAATGDYVVTLKSGALTVQKTIKIDVEILLTWDDNSGNEDGFKIERSPDGSTDWTEIAAITNPDIESYGVTKAKNGIDSAEMNFFRVYAYNATGPSANPTNTESVRCS